MPPKKKKAKFRRGPNELKNYSFGNCLILHLVSSSHMWVWLGASANGQVTKLFYIHSVTYTKFTEL